MIRTVSVLAALLVTAVGGRAYGQRALGLDVSAWQGNLSSSQWNSFHTSGDRDFVIIRSSRGGTTGYYNQSNADNDPPTNTFSQRYDDPYYIQNITRATSAGLLAGSYHFSRPDVVEDTLNSGGIANSGADEANHFMQMAGPWMRPGYLLPMHDLEAGDGIRSDNDMAQFTLDFSDRIYEVMGIRPGIYLSGNYASFVLGGASQSLRDEIVEKHPVLWTARWPNQDDPESIPVHTGHPKDSYTPIYGPWDDSGDTHPWTFWQYTSRGRLSGYGSNLDLNVAQGGIEFLKDQLVPAVWMNNSSGNWNTLANWNSGQTPVAPVQGPGQVARVGGMTLPTPRAPGVDDTLRGVQGDNDTVILDRPSAEITVTHSSGTHNIRKLFVKEALEITGGTLSVGYVPSADSTPISAQFSAPVTLSGGTLSMHTLQVDAGQALTLAGGNLSVNKINLMRQSVTPGKIVVEGDVSFTPLANAAASIAVGGGSGSVPFIDLAGGSRTFNVANGAADADLSIGVVVANGALTKTGAGTLALAVASSYAGDTTVQAGRLRLSDDSLRDAADVYLTSGSALDLTFGSGTPDIIDSLFIDGVSQQAGVWGGEGTGAEFTSPLITGTGRLQVTTYLAPIPGDFNGDGVVNDVDLTAWQVGYGMPGGAGSEHGDADGDGAVDGADFLVWQKNLGATSVPAAAANAAAIPEPAAAALMLLAGAGLFCRRGTFLATKS